MDSDASRLFLDHELTVAEVEDSNSAFEKVLDTIDGGERITQTHIAIAFY